MKDDGCDKEQEEGASRDTDQAADDAANTSPTSETRPSSADEADPRPAVVRKDAVVRRAASLQTGLKDLGRPSRIVEDIALGRSRLSDLALAIGGGASSALADWKRTQSLLGGAGEIARQLASTKASLAMTGGIEETMRRFRQQDEMVKALGGFDAIQQRHSTIAETISAMGGFDSILKSQQQMSDTLRAIGAGIPHRLIVDQILPSASMQIEHAMRKLAGISSFTNVASAIASDQARYDQVLSAVTDMRDLGDQVSLHARLQAQLPDLFPQWRRAEKADFIGLQLSRLGERFLRQNGVLTGIQEEILRLRRPWVDVEHPRRSVSAYVEARALQDVISSSPPESRAVVAAVRAELGDYRATEAIPEVVVADPMLRSAFRIDVGFNTDLTSLPPAILAKIFAPGADIGRSSEADPDALEAFIHRRVRQIERRLRQFIIAAMTDACGPQWMKQRVDGETRKRWKERRQVDVDNGRRPGGPLDYAGFEDYRSIIDRNDNWAEVFEPIFKVRVSILETLRRLSLIRNPDAHFRVVTIDDLIDLASEAGRLDRWLGLDHDPS